MSVQAMSWVLEESASTGNDRLVLLAIANHLGYRDEDQGCWPSVERLAAEAGGLDRRTVQRCVARLVESGELIVERGGGRHRSNTYRLAAFGKKGRHDAAVSEGGNGGADAAVSEPERAAPGAQRAAPEARKGGAGAARTGMNRYQNRGTDAVTDGSAAAAAAQRARHQASLAADRDVTPAPPPAELRARMNGNPGGPGGYDGRHER